MTNKEILQLIAKLIRLLATIKFWFDDGKPEIVSATLHKVGVECQRCAAEIDERR